MIRTTEMQFINGQAGHLLRVDPDMPASDALALAGELAEGVELLCKRLSDDLDEGESAYVSEVRAIGFLGETASALIQSVARDLKAKEAAQ